MNMGDLDQGFKPTENVNHSQSTLGFDASLSEQSSGEQHNYILLKIKIKEQKCIFYENTFKVCFSLFLSLFYDLCT